MTNPLRGEGTFIVNRREYQLVMDINALCSAEGQLGMGVDEILVTYSRQTSMLLVRGLLWAALRRHHPELSIDDVGDLMGESSFPTAKAALERVLLAAMPDPDDKAQKKREPRGRAVKTKDGTG